MTTGNKEIVKKIQKYLYYSIFMLVFSQNGGIL